MKFDVFISHNSEEKPLVRELARRLEAMSVRVWLDENELVPGLNWQPLLEKGIKESSSGIVLIGKNGIGPWEDEEAQALLRDAVSSGKAVIPVLLPGAPKKPELPLFLRNRTWVDLRNGYSDSLDDLVWGITGRKPISQKKRSHQIQKTNKYKPWQLSAILAIVSLCCVILLIILVMASQDQPEQVASQDQPEQVASQDQPEQVASQDQPEQVASQDQPEQVASQDQPEQVASQGLFLSGVSSIVDEHHVINFQPPKNSHTAKITNLSSIPVSIGLVGFPEGIFYTSLKDEISLIKPNEDQSFRILFLNAVPERKKYNFTINVSDGTDIKVDIELTGDWIAFYQTQLLNIQDRLNTLIASENLQSNAESIYEEALKQIDVEYEDPPEDTRDILVGNALKDLGEIAASALAFSRAKNLNPELTHRVLASAPANLITAIGKWQNTERLIDHIASGRLFTFTLYRNIYDIGCGIASGTGYLGNLIAGDTYATYYVPSQKAWVTEGRLQADQDCGFYNNAIDTMNLGDFVVLDFEHQKIQMNIWGTIFSFDELGYLYHNDTRIGRIDSPF